MTKPALVVIAASILSLFASGAARADDDDVVDMVAPLPVQPDEGPPAPAGKAAIAKECSWNLLALRQSDATADLTARFNAAHALPRFAQLTFPEFVALFAYTDQHYKLMTPLLSSQTDGGAALRALAAAPKQQYPICGKASVPKASRTAAACPCQLESVALAWAGLKKVTPNHQPTDELYRGENWDGFSAIFRQGYKTATALKSKRLRSKAFFSTTLGVNRAWLGRPAAYRIRDTAMLGRSIREISNVPTEAEVLLPPLVKFKVLGLSFRHVVSRIENDADFGPQESAKGLLTGLKLDHKTKTGTATGYVKFELGGENRFRAAEGWEDTAVKGKEFNLSEIPAQPVIYTVQVTGRAEPVRVLRQYRVDMETTAK